MSGLSAPGSSVYSSGSMHVGDGTWDSERDTFLLPNLQGLNYNTMRYNGMGNRFKTQPGYHSLIRAHGALAAIVFLAIVPAAIMIARFYHRNPRLALRMHIWLQILTLLVMTVVFVLGWMAVGPERSLTNPHHGIGLAIYILIWFQFLFGAFIRRIEKNKQRNKIPLKLYLHQWMGRGIALLGLAQIPLGLTLYGSPLVLFILYALAAFLLLVIYFTLSYRHRTPFFLDGDDMTYFSGSRTDFTEETRSHHNHRGLKGLAAAGAAGAGLAALARRRSRSRHGHDEEVAGSRHSSHSPHRRHSGSYIDEKYDETPGKKHTWRNRILGAGAGIGALAAAKKLFGGKNDRDSHVGSYGHPLGGAHSVNPTDISAVEEGHAPASPETPQPLGPGRPRPAAAVGALTSPSRSHRRRSRRSGESLDSSSLLTEEITPKKDHTARNTIAAVGVAGFLRRKLTQRRDKKEEQRIEDQRIQEEMEQERNRRQNSRRQRFTGDGAPPRRSRTNRTSTTIGGHDDMLGSNPELSLSHLPRPGTAAGAGAQATAGAAPGPYGQTNLPARSTVQSLATAPSIHVPGSLGPSSAPPVPVIAANTATHDPFVTEQQQYQQPPYQQPPYQQPPYQQPPYQQMPEPPQHAGITPAQAIAGAAVAAPVIAGASSSRPNLAQQSGRRTSDATSIASPPVSVKVKMHNDGRHVTLRRLNEQEAAAERQARRREARRRNGSISSVSDMPGDPGRYRRGNVVSPMPGGLAATESTIGGAPAMAATSGPIQMPAPPPNTDVVYPQVPQTSIPVDLPGPPPRQSPYTQMPQPGVPYQPSPISTISGLPPPPPIPGMNSGMSGGVNSPVTGPYDTGTDVSAYDTNRRRRRAERAQQASQQAGKVGGGRNGGSRVEFT